MLIETITFDIHNFKNHTDDSFVVRNTPGLYELIAAQKGTRNIHFEKHFEMDFINKEKTPKFVLFADVVDRSFAQNADLEIDDIDEMVGGEY